MRGSPRAKCWRFFQALAHLWAEATALPARQSGAHLSGARRSWHWRRGVLRGRAQFQRGWPWRQRAVPSSERSAASESATPRYSADPCRRVRRRNGYGRRYRLESGPALRNHVRFVKHGGRAGPGTRKGSVRAKTAASAPARHWAGWATDGNRAFVIRVG